MALLNQTQQQYYDNGNYGDYQFISLKDLIDTFIFVYVGEEKIINKAKRSDVVFHAKRAMQEMSFDTFKSVKSQEVTVPSTLSVVLPQDYVNYVKLSWSDSAGIMHVIYPTKYTKNPEPILQNEQGEYKLQAVGTMTDGSTTIVLNKEYKNILVGMVVSAPNVPAGATVTSVTNNSSITTITISDPATYTGDETLTFTNVDGSLIFEEESAFILEDLTIVSGSNKITANSTSDANQIKVGMLVSSIDFPVGTTVIDVNGSVITTSENAITVSTEATFLSNKKISQTLSNYRSYTPDDNVDKYDDGTYDLVVGERYGLNPEQAQVNGTFYINNGYIYFSSNISGKNVIIDYISDGLGTDEEMQVHKLAEEAMYRYIAHAILAGKANVPEYIVNRFKKEKFAAIRQAKLRLSNIKLEEITQVLRNKSKWIKH
tara:strand:- start:13475 stop:14764 length:1290 start_codon:yes stop_codon:yes gene_type:complete